MTALVPGWWKGLELVRVGIAKGDRCALCGSHQPGAHFTNEDGKRYWEGREVKDQYDNHGYYLPDLPERLCRCEGRSK